MADEKDRPNEARHDDQEPAPVGDVLGISDSPPEVEIPRATPDRGGNPAGIEVREHATGTGDLKRGTGATGIDMGAGGTGTGLASDTSKPATARQDLNE
jgi:hypothetical protein